MNPEKTILLSSAASYVFVDSNVIFECKPLIDLPWHELSTPFPLVLVFVPQVLKEVDSKKQDGRIGKRAREFNRLLVQVTEHDDCMLLPNQAKPIYLTIGKPRRIDWGRFGEEDPDDGDTRVALEIAHLPGDLAQRGVLVSNDVKPIWLAKNFGIKSHHAADDWRRPAEPSPKDKEIQKLKGRLAELEINQPKLSLEIDAEMSGFKRFAVAPVSSESGQIIGGGLMNRHPPPRERSGLHPQLTIALYGHEEGIVTPNAYKRFTESIPAFLDKLPHFLEQEHGQFPFSIRVKNVGPLRAQNLVLKVSCASGWMNGRPVLFPTRGPEPKKTRRESPMDWVSRQTFFHRPHRHEMHMTEKPSRSQAIEVQCEDFPSGESWIFEGYACIDPRSSEPFVFNASLTAANLHGAILTSTPAEFPFQVVEADVSDLVDLTTLEPLAKAQARLDILQRIEDQRYEDVDFVGDVNDD